MAKKRMFNLGVLETDAFLDMPLSAQALYFHLNMRADDDGFVGNPKRITQNIGASVDDLKVLVAKRFLIAFEDGVIVIKHWRMHNIIKKDRYTKTNFIEDLNRLKIKDNGAYTMDEGTLAEHVWNADGTQMEHERNTDGEQMGHLSSAGIGIGLGKLSIGKDNKYIPASETDAEPQCESWFTAFWDSYPKKKDKANAVKAFRKVCKTEEDYNTIMSGLMNQIPLWKDPQYIPYPATWLNGKRWEDDLSTDKLKAMSPMQKFLYGGLNER